MPFGVELVVLTVRVVLLNFPGVRGTGLMVKEKVGPLLTMGETVVDRRALPDKPRLPRVTVELLELPATMLMEEGFAEIVKLPTTTMLRVTECFRLPLVPVTVRR